MKSLKPKASQRSSWLSPKWDANISFLRNVGRIIATDPFISAGSVAVIRVRTLWELVRATHFGEMGDVSTKMKQIFS